MSNTVINVSNNEPEKRKKPDEVMGISITKGKSGYYYARITGHGGVAGFPLIPGVVEGHASYIEKEFGLDDNTAADLLSFLDSYAVHTK